jgi:competence protein CoiA
LLDATSLTDAGWAEIYKVRPRAELCCPSCGGGVHAKVSSSALRFFAHDRRAPSCPSAGETEAHLTLKREIVALARAAGWEAQLEVPGEGWRADVLVSRAGLRISFEVQLSAMTAEEGRRRTQKFTESGARVVWVTSRDAPWLYAIPSVKVTGSPGAFEVTRGCASWGTWWDPAPPFSFANFVRAVLADKLVAEELDYLSELVARGDRTVERWYQPALCWVKPAHSDAFHAQYDALRADEAKRAADELDHQRRIIELLERQRRLVPAAMELARSESGLAAWAGDGRSWHAADAIPGESFAMGVPIWVGRDRPETLWGVVCPVASRASAMRPTLRAVRVFAADDKEAERIARVRGTDLDVEVLEASEEREPTPRSGSSRALRAMVATLTGTHTESP